MKQVHLTDSAEETEELGRQFAGRLSAGDVVALTGELGGGKTTFVKGIAKGLDVKGYVKSPSFTIVHIYGGGRLTLYHIDLYRISGAEEVHNLGLEEYIYGEGVSVIEWAERAVDILPEEAIRISFFYEGGMERRIEVEMPDK